MLRKPNSQNHHTKDSLCAALSCILQLSSFCGITYIVRDPKHFTGPKYFQYISKTLLFMSSGDQKVLQFLVWAPAGAGYLKQPGLNTKKLGPLDKHPLFNLRGS